MSLSISIFTPTHNTTWLQEAYDSFKDQDFHEWIVVYNNGANPIEFNDPRVKAFVLPMAPEWVGPLKAYACEQATGDILLELDHDDLLTPDCLEEVQKAFADPEVGFVYSNTIHAMMDGSKGMRFGEEYGWKYREVDFYGRKFDEHISFPPDANSVSRIWFAPNHVRSFRRDKYLEVGGYNKEMRILDDLDLMCRLYAVSKFKHIDKGLYVYRVHGKNTWLRYNKEIQDNVYRIYDANIFSLTKRWAEINDLRKIDLGGRLGRIDGFESVDKRNADVLCDLNKKWPFKDNSVGVVRAFDVLEHLRDPIHAMKEIYRVLAPGGWLLSLTPSTDGRGAFQDPTHVSFWNQNSFLYYTDRRLAVYIDSPVRFQAPRLYTTAKDADEICHVVAHLCALKGDFRPPGLIAI